MQGLLLPCRAPAPRAQARGSGRAMCRGRAAAQVVRAVQSPERVEREANGKAAAVPECDGVSNVYPEFEKGRENEGLFPVREPGNFPEIAVEGHAAAPRCHTQAPEGFLAQISAVDFSESAPLQEDAWDPLRDGPLRFLGYSNEVGEAFAAWLPPGGVPFSYFMAISYVLVDTYDKGLKAYRRAHAEFDGRPDIPASVDRDALARLLTAERVVDTAVWQLVASVAAPGYTIHTIVALTTAALLAAEGLDAAQGAAGAAAAALGLPADVLLQYVNKSLPTAVGLATIPFIVHPIDNGVHWVMNKTLRPAMRKYVCAQGGAAAGLSMCDESCKADFEN